MATALGDTESGLTIALSAMELATTMCAHGSPEAADKALALAEQTLQLTVQKLAKAQLMVEAQEQQQHRLQLSASAAHGGCTAAAASPEHSVASPTCAGFAGAKDDDDGNSCADSNCSIY